MNLKKGLLLRCKQMKQNLELKDLDVLLDSDLEILYLWARNRDYLEMALIKDETGKMVSKLKPLLTIGQLIEYLNSVQISKDETEKWVLIVGDSKYRGEELLYLLWEAVKSKLLLNN